MSGPSANTARGGKGLAIVAVGGNSLIVNEQRQSIPDQYEAASATVRHVVDMIEAGWQVVLAHGNGPQVGFILRRSEIAIDEVPPVSMDYATGETQGAIGWMFQRAMTNEFHRRGLSRKAIAITTQVRVAPDDPAFDHPTKPIGSLMDEAKARRLAGQQGWIVKADAGRGWRRVVPSPQPLAIIELETISLLLGEGYAVIACGGGGIPVIADESGSLQGVEAVIDKDMASSLLATQLQADLFLISTGVEKVATGFHTPKPNWLDRITLAEARRYTADGEFDKGSMGPKIMAMIRYLEHGGTLGLITDPPHLSDALEGRTGTRLVAGE